MQTQSNQSEKLISETPTSDLLKQRDAAALEELLKRYRPLMQALVADSLYPAVKSKVDPSDLVQDACAEIVKSFAVLDCQRSQSFIAYIRQIVLSKLIDVRRRYLVTQKRDVRVERPDAIKANVQVDDCPLRNLMEVELWEHTEAALAKLPLDVRKLIELRYVDRLSFVQIGKMLDRNPDTVRVGMDRWLKRVRMELRAKYSSSSSDSPTLAKAPTPSRVSGQPQPPDELSGLT